MTWLERITSDSCQQTGTLSEFIASKCFVALLLFLLFQELPQHVCGRNGRDKLPNCYRVPHSCHTMRMTPLLKRLQPLRITTFSTKVFICVQHIIISRTNSNITYQGFFEEDGQLLRDAHKLHDIPAVIVHGRYDCVCPFEGAWALHRAWPQAELIICPEAGHSGTDDVFCCGDVVANFPDLFS
jgi:hypothetical protein